MIDFSEIIFDSSCKYDDAGRVFYARGRVFRAIDSCAQHRILEFLNSELCHYLIDNQLLVDTWISEEVIIPGYPLVLEHEKVFCSRPSEWSFEMKKMVAIAAIDLIDISYKYGYFVKDPYESNFSISCGKIIYYDFGSFIRNNSPSDADLRNRYMVLTHFLPLMLSANKSGYINVSFGKILPVEKVDCAPIIMTLSEKMISKYGIFCHFRHKNLHFSTRIKFFYEIIPLINDFLIKCFPKALGKKTLLRRVIIYKPFGKREINSIRNPFRKVFSILPIEASGIISYANRLMTEDNIAVKTVLCIGNFDFGELLKLQSRVEKNVNLMSHDSVYVDTFFKSLVSCPGKINSICGNIVELHSEHDVKKKEYGGELVIIQDQLDILSRALYSPHQCDIGPYRKPAIVDAIASYCQAYLLVPSKIDPEFIGLIEEQFTICHSRTYLKKEYRLFKKNSYKDTV